MMISRVPTEYMIAHAKSFQKDFKESEWIDFQKYTSRLIRLHLLGLVPIPMLVSKFLYEDKVVSEPMIEDKELFENWLLCSFLWDRGYTDFIDPSTQTYVYVDGGY
tara:strand:- start:941 stop:1258 length:318 start_codon:yes stop_codon:yes gene_type:complete